MPSRTTVTVSSSENNDQGYLASVSDLMSILLFLFIIILMAFVVNLQRQTIQAELQNQELKEQTMKAEKVTKELTDARRVRAELLQDIANSLSQNGVTVRIDTEKGILRVPEDILFPSGQATFMQQGERRLALLANVLGKKLPCYSGRKGTLRPAACLDGEYLPERLDAVLIEGHTDDVPITGGRFEDNWQLSSERSLSTFRYLLKYNGALGELRNGDDEMLFGISAYADTRPAQSNDSKEGREANRRIDLRFILATPKTGE